MVLLSRTHTTGLWHSRRLRADRFHQPGCEQLLRWSIPKYQRHLGGQHKYLLVFGTHDVSWVWQRASVTSISKDFGRNAHCKMRFPWVIQNKSLCWISIPTHAWRRRFGCVVWFHNPIGRAKCYGN